MISNANFGLILLVTLANLIIDPNIGSYLFLTPIFSKSEKKDTKRSGILLLKLNSKDFVPTASKMDYSVCNICPMIYMNLFLSFYHLWPPWSVKIHVQYSKNLISWIFTLFSYDWKLVQSWDLSLCWGQILNWPKLQAKWVQN